MVRTAADILAEVRLSGDELNTAVAPAAPLLAPGAEVRYRRRGAGIDIDMGIGRLTCGWANIHRYARVWHGDLRPADLPDLDEPDVPRRGRPRKGCPAEMQYRRHLKAGEHCFVCWPYMAAVRVQRRREGRGGK